MTGDEATMSLLEHLEELRSRIIVVVIAVVLAGIVGFFLADPIIALLRAPLARRATELIQTRVGGGVRRPDPDRAHDRHRARDAGDPLRGLGLRHPGPDPRSAAWCGRCSAPP